MHVYKNNKFNEGVLVNHNNQMLKFYHPKSDASYIPQGNLLSRMKIFEDFMDVYWTSKYLSLKL